MYSSSVAAGKHSGVFLAGRASKNPANGMEEATSELFGNTTPTGGKSTKQGKQHFKMTCLVFIQVHSALSRLQINTSGQILNKPQGTNKNLPAWKLRRPNGSAVTASVWLAVRVCVKPFLHIIKVTEYFTSFNDTHHLAG